jgi:hypothetical protein
MIVTHKNTTFETQHIIIEIINEENSFITIIFHPKYIYTFLKIALRILIS